MSPITETGTGSPENHRFWRSIDELAGAAAGPLPNRKMPLDRRRMLKLMGASLTLAGLAGCTTVVPPRKIVPYVHEPSEIIPGHPLYFATAMPLGGYGRGLLVESHMGRPTKVEGNPRHPASLGATDPYAQASVLSLYDQDRARSVSRRSRPASWATYVSAMEGEVRTGFETGCRIADPDRERDFSNPVLAVAADPAALPQAKWHQYDPDNGSTQLAGSLLAFGEPVWTRYRFESADIVLSLDSDFLTEGPAWLHYSRHWAERRQRRNGSGGMSRLYALESTPTCTGAVADNRLAVRASEIEDFARTVFRRVEMNVQKSPQPQTSDLRGLWADAVARDLLQHRGSSIVVPGTHQPAAVHALAHSLNHALGNTNKTVIHTAPVEPAPVDHIESLTELVGEMKQGKVDLLIILSFDPVFTAPADLEFAEALKRTVTSVYLGMYNDETAASASWHVPEAHFLESWGDVRAFDGSATIIQPLIMPLYGGRSPHEILALLQENPSATPYETVRRYWQSASQAKDFENFWTSALQTGVVPDTAFDSKDVTLQNRTPKAARRGRRRARNQFQDRSLRLRWTFSNNGWLQELPKPLTKLTWDNAALMSPATARSLGFDPNDVSRTGSQGLPVPLVELRYRGRSVQAPIFLLPGHPDNSVTAHLGYGLQRGGKHATGRGFNAYALRTSEAPWFYSGLEVRKLDSTAMLATTNDIFR